MHDAYVVLPPATIPVQIESITGYGKNLILGTRQGHLLMYAIEQQANDTKMELQLLQYDKNFSKKPIVQIDVIPEYELLFSLSDSIINVNDISRHNFPLVHCAKTTKGATMFALDIKRLQSVDSKTAIVARMCVAIKKKLQLRYWKRLQLIEFENVNEIDLNDIPKALAWSGNTICVGFKTEYVLYDITENPPKKHDLFPTSSSRTIDACISIIDDFFAVAKDEYLIAVDPDLQKSNSINSPSSRGGGGGSGGSGVGSLGGSGVSGGNAAASGGNAGASGVATGAAAMHYDVRKSFKSFAWSQPIQILCWDEPYAVALIPNAIEIRTIDSNNGSSNKETLIQTISDVQKARFLIRLKNGVLIAASTTQLWCITMVDIPKQRQMLLQQKKFQLALQLTDISDESVAEKSEKKHQIQTLYAFDLFANKQFKQSMNEFEKLETDPCDVIRLFPDLLAPQDGLKSSTTTATAKLANLPVLEDRDLENGLLALIDYLTGVRYHIKLSIETTTSAASSSSLSSSSTNNNNNNIVGGSTITTTVTKPPLRKNFYPLLSIIDTTLLKCYLQTNDLFVAPLIRLNCCHLEESEKILKQYQKLEELIILYQTKGHHKKALQLLQSQAGLPGSNLSGQERTIKYLQELGNEHKQLIFEFANWVLENYPEDGLKIFTDDVQEEENLSRAEILDYLLKNHKTLVIPYLEHVIHMWNEPKSIFHNILIQQYREKINDLNLEIKNSPPGIGTVTTTTPTTEASSPSSTATKLDENENNFKQSNQYLKQQLSNTLSKLTEFLKKSNKYIPENALRNFPYDSLFEERAIILGKLGKHEKVLAIYIQILGDIEKATEYCESVYQLDNKNKTIYIQLIRTLLIPPTTPPYSGVPLHPKCTQPNIESVLELLEKHAIKLDPYAVLQILSDDIPLFKLRTFLELSLHHQLERRRRNQVLIGLLYAENLQTQEQRMHLESKYAIVTEYSVCPVCKKKFTNQSAFVRYPNGEMVHFSCQDKE